MKAKRFLALALVAIMVFSSIVMTGCTKSSNNEEREKSGIVTLNMFVITEEETSSDAARQVQMAINEITVPQHKMLVKINYVTADKYWETVDAAEEEVVEYLSGKANKKPTAVTTETGAEEETTKAKPIGEMHFNEAIDYVFDLNDIELENPQIDVIIADSYDKFLELVENNRVSEIDIKYDRKVLTKYIHPTILASTYINKKTYGIPTNFAMEGEYEFLVYNKNLLDKYGYIVDDVEKIEDMGEYLSIIKRNEPGFYPISDIPELSGAEIYDGTLFTKSSLEKVNNASTPLFFSNAVYMLYLKAVQEYRQNGYVASYAGVNNAKYAIEYVVTNELLDREWTDETGTTYQALLYDIPRITGEKAFKSAMCVSAYSLNKSKAAELIELFNTDSKLANLLQYGIEGKNYRQEDGIVTFIDTLPEATYKMDNFLTGNVYVKYATQEDADYIENAKQSNLSIAPSSFFGYVPQFNDVGSKSTYECVKSFSESALNMLKNGEISIDDAFNIAGKQLAALGCTMDERGNVQGMFGKIANEQKSATAQTANSFILSDEAGEYNDVYMSAEEIAEELAALEAEKAAEEAAKLEAERAALEAQIEAENAANEEPFDEEYEEVAE